MKGLGIVILNYNSYVDTMDLLKDLSNQKLISFKVMLIDNFSTNDSVQQLREYISDNNFNYELEFIEHKMNKGYSSGNNIGIKELYKQGYEYCLVLNNDIVFQSVYTISNILLEMKKKSNCGVLGPGIIQRDKIEIPLLENRPTFLSEVLENIFYPFSILLNKYKRKKFNYNTREVYAISGCCFICDLKIMDEVDYLDEEIFLYGEELILSEKLFKLDKSVIFTPEILVIHNHSVTIGSIYKNNKIVEMQLKSKKYYYEWYREDINYVQKNIINVTFRIKKMYMKIINLLRTGV